MKEKRTWTIANVLEWTREYFQRKRLDTPRLDAELIVAHALSLDRISLYTQHHKPLSERELGEIRNLVRRRAEYEPVHYILGYREFWSLRLMVDPRVLIPRPDTERLVEIALKVLGEGAKAVLDLCTGSGAVALAIGSEGSRFTVLGTDICDHALAVAQENQKALALSNVSFMRSDLFDSVQGSYDAIVTNPPYISKDALNSLMPDVRKYEPRLALDGGHTGLDFYERIVSHAHLFLNTGGSLMMEIGHDQTADLQQIIRRNPLLEMKDCYRDLAGCDRVIHAIKVS